MCGRFANVENTDMLQRRFTAEAVDLAWDGQDDCRPTQPLPVVVASRAKRWLRPATWGLRFDWAKQPLINARAETAPQKRSFAALWQRQRCLIPASAFYEWDAGQRCRISCSDLPLFAMAGLWQPSETGARFVILTTAANELIQPIHERMPVILPPELETSWLQGELQRVLEPYPTTGMRLKR
jgi:putative SOS response-associated peptidase YedK